MDYDNHTLFRGDVKKHGSPVRIFTNIHPQKIKLSAVEGYRYKILLPFLWETFFLSISTFEKKVKMSSISRLKIKLILHIVYGDTCTTFLWYDGRKIYAHVQVCTGMIVYFHVQLVHACTCILMVQ